MRPLDPRVLPHLVPARGPLVGVVVGNAAAGVLVVAQAFALGHLLTSLLGDPASAGWHAPALVFALLLAARAVVTGLADVAGATAAGRVGRHLRHTVLRRALDLDPGDLAARRTGELGLLATRGVAAVEPYLTRYLPALVVAAVLPVLTVVAIATQDWLSALVVVCTLPLVPVFAILIGLTTRDRAEDQWRVLAQLAGHFVDVVRGLPTLVAHRRAHAQSARIREVTDRHRRASRDVLRLAFASSAALELVATLSVALVAVLVGLRLAAGGLDLQTALVVLLLAPEAYWPLRRVGAEFHAAAEGTATFEAIHALTSGGASAGGDRAPSGRVPQGAVGRVLGHTTPTGSVPETRLEDLTVTWPGREHPALQHLDARIPARGLTVVTGPSGCGKSTLLAALLGEVPVAGGRILVGDLDLADGDPDERRAHAAYLPQKPWLLDGTVADNVRIGRPGADDDEVAAALRAVDLLDALPHGIDTVLAEDGAGLSAGQRARLALARVLVSQRPLVLLDEPTAHLDAASEQVLLRVVRDLARTRCVVAVAHRDALVEAADHVIALAAPVGGRVVPDPVPEGRVPQDTARRVLGHTTPTTPAHPTTPAAPPTPGRIRARLAGATVLSVLAASAGVALTATAGWLIARSAEHPPVLMLMVAIVGVRTFGLARPVLRYAERLLSHDVALRLLAQRRAAVYDALVPLVPGRLGRRRGDLLASVVDDVDAVLDEQLRVRLPLATWLGTTLVTAAVAGWFLPSAGLVVLAGLVVGTLAGLTAYAGSRRHAAARVAARALVSRRAVQLLGDARSLVQWQADRAALARVDAAGDELARATVAGARWLALARAWPLVAAGLGVPLVAALGASALARVEVSGPVVALLALVPLALVDVTSPVADAGALRVETRAASQRLDDLTAMTPAVTDPAPAVPLPPGAATVSLDRVRAGWDGPGALGPVTLRLGPGRAVGVIGPSGSGKSTLAAVLVRFLAPASGSHEVAGVPVADLHADDVRRVVGLLDDDPHLFASTLVENVRLARPDATDAEVEGALRAVSLGPWLDDLPRGLHTWLGDGAAAVSGGERARIGLARLLLADLPVLVLDEPTAHLDHDTARRVTDDLLASRGHRGIVWITHGTVGLGAMDEVLDLGPGVTGPGAVPVDRGRVLAEG